MYSTTAAICSGVRRVREAGHRSPPLGDDGDLVRGVGEAAHGHAGAERGPEAAAAVLPVAGRAPGGVERGALVLGSGGRDGCGLGGLVDEQQDHESGDDHRGEDLDDVHDAVQHGDAQKLGKPTLSKNHSELVSQSTTREANSTPPMTGRAHPGSRAERTHSTLVTNAP